PSFSRASRSRRIDSSRERIASPASEDFPFPEPKALRVSSSAVICSSRLIRSLVSPSVSAYSFRVNTFPTLSGFIEMRRRLWSSVIVKMRSAQSISSGRIDRARWEKRIPRSPSTRRVFSEASAPSIANSPAERTDTFSPSSPARRARIASAIGLRQVLPVQTSRTFFTGSISPFAPPLSVNSFDDIHEKHPQYRPGGSRAPVHFPCPGTHFLGGHPQDRRDGEHQSGGHHIGPIRQKRFADPGAQGKHSSRGGGRKENAKGRVAGNLQRSCHSDSLGHVVHRHRQGQENSQPVLGVKADADGHSLRRVVGRHRQNHEKTQPGKGGALSAAPIPPFEAVQEDHQQQGGGHAQHHVGPTPVADSGGKEAPQGDGQHDAHRHPQGKGEPPLGQGTEPQHNEGPEQGGHAGKGAVCDRFTHRQDLTAGI